MVKLAGKLVTINYVGDYFYEIEEDLNYHWDDTMFEDTEIVEDKKEVNIISENIELEIKLIELSLKYRTTVTDVYQRYEYFKKKLEKNPTI